MMYPNGIHCNRCAIEYPASFFEDMHGNPEDGYYCPCCYSVQEWEEGRKAADTEIITSLLYELLSDNAPPFDYTNPNPPDSTAVCDGFIERTELNQFRITTGRGEGPFTITIIKESEKTT